MQHAGLTSPKENANPPRIYFQHVPKTAGTTLRNHLILQMGDGRVAPMLRSISFADAMLEYGSFDVVTGHIAAIPGDRLPTNRTCITLLRDPLDRALSEFFFTTTVHTSGVRVGARFNCRVDEWVATRTDSDVAVLNAHMHALWAFGFGEPRVPSIEERIRAAKAALDAFDFVGVQDELEESIAMLDFRMGWPALDTLPVDNPTPSRPATADLAPRTRARLLDLLGPDSEIFEYAKSRFARDRRAALISAARMHAAPISDYNGPTGARACVPATTATEEPGVMTTAHSGTREVVMDTVAVSGDISGGDFIQTGEWVTVRITFSSMIHEAHLTAGIAIRDHAGALVFGTNTLLLGSRIAVVPGRYAVSFRFPNDLGMGRYSVTAALHRGSSHLDCCFHWWEHAITFEVANSVAEPFQGRVRLHMDSRVESLTDSSRVDVALVDGDGKTSVASLGRRNPALRDFRAKLQAMDTLDHVARAADGLMKMRITNSGGERWGAYGRRAVHVSHHWLASDGEVAVFDGLRTALPYDVEPGHTLQLSCFFRAPETEGDATLVWTLVQEEVGWFDARDPTSRLLQTVPVIG